MTICFATKATSQTPSQKLIKEIVKEYNAFNYQQAEQKAEQALLNYHQFTTNELVELHKYLALIYFARGKTDESQKQFKTALSVNPGLVLSSLYVSPKIIEFFNKVKAEVKSETRTSEDLTTKYILVKDKRFGASLRSLAVPGWGHIYKGEKNKGIALISLWTAGLSGLLVTHLEYNKAFQAYKDAEEPDDIESTYSRCNSYYKARNSIAVFTVALWLYAHIDAALKKEKSPGFSIRNEGNFIIPHIDDDKIILTCSWQFNN